MKDIAALDPRMVKGVIKYQARCLQEGIPTMVLETRRELSTQMAYYARGRCPVEVVKAYFERCKLWKITDAEAKVPNTKTLYSKHIDGLAADIVPMKDGKPWWDAPNATWMIMCKIAEEECGLDFCAAGKNNSWNWDWAHVEFLREIS